jgi:hypothetical protein
MWCTFRPATLHLSIDEKAANKADFNRFRRLYSWVIICRTMSGNKQSAQTALE